MEQTGQSFHCRSCGLTLDAEDIDSAGEPSNLDITAEIAQQPVTESFVSRWRWKVLFPSLAFVFLGIFLSGLLLGLQSGDTPWGRLILEKLPAEAEGEYELSFRVSTDISGLQNFQWDAPSSPLLIRTSRGSEEIVLAATKSARDGSRDIQLLAIPGGRSSLRNVGSDLFSPDERVVDAATSSTDQLFLLVRNKNRAKIIALDAQNELMWSHETSATIIAGLQPRIDAVKDTVIVLLPTPSGDGAQLIKYDAAGFVVWRMPIKIEDEQRVEVAISSLGDIAVATETPSGVKLDTYDPIGQLSYSVTTEREASSRLASIQITDAAATHILLVGPSLSFYSIDHQGLVTFEDRTPAQALGVCTLAKSRSESLSAVCVDTSGFQIVPLDASAADRSPIPLGTSISAGTPRIVTSNDAGVLASTNDASYLTFLPASAIERAIKGEQRTADLTLGAEGVSRPVPEDRPPSQDIPPNLGTDLIETAEAATISIADEDGAAAVYNSVSDAPMIFCTVQCAHPEIQGAEFPIEIQVISQLSRPLADIELDHMRRVAEICSAEGGASPHMPTVDCEVQN